ncbi:hypothetical protein BBW68_03980 [Candidatus Erwinia dacicola]|uniref:Pyrimidine nucleoside phosphorylase C-terminal domain protein n=1 Tax=Candidatus Erwinia dacicola TaxID=252393 RepID=A0A1E7Z4R8_9GAMM|nr:hypothetical protein BBW68_03980 [Candidatus Erwinia dacicola]RAP70754.1 pyrimidine nucleoside phosphorylase C-terminal domain protein [Candidatus Erwinia dacicola]
MAVVSMGGGRPRASGSIDYSVCFSEMAQLGDSVDAQCSLAVIHAATEARWQEAAAAVKRAVAVGSEQPQATPVIYRKIS